MHASASAIAGLGMLVSAWAMAAAPPTLPAGLDDRVLAWRRDFHQFPELGNQERRTAGKVAKILRASGLEVREGVAMTGVVALLRGGQPGPRIALRADMDALPVTEAVDLPFASKVTAQFRGETVGVMHACGHDAHTAILLGVAQALAAMREQLAGEVLFVFQPAEEGPPEGEEGGARLMLKQDLFGGRPPTAMYGLHVWAGLHANQIGYRSGPAMAASDHFGILVQGRQTHGSQPWSGVDPIVIAAELVVSAQQVVSRELNISRLPVVLSFGAIKGGIRYNIIPDRVELIGTLRTFDSAMRRDALDRLARISEHTAAAHGGSAVLSVAELASNPVLENNAALVERHRPGLRAVAGVENTVEMPLVMGAEDFAHFAQQVPAFYFFVGATAPGTDLAQAAPNHSAQFRLDESALKLGVRALLQIAVDALAVPQ